MQGKLGSLHKGKLQIGGIGDWRLDMMLTDQSKDTETYYKLIRWTVTAQSYWLFDLPEEITIRLYSQGKGFWEGRCCVTSPYQKLFDTMIHSQIEFVGEGVLEGRE